jgi:putative exporter of polyketide antibiotics
MPTSITYDLVQNIAVLVILPLIIWLNLRRRARANPIHARLWHDYANLMRVSVLILTLLTLFATCAVLTDLGLISEATEEKIAMAIGIPFLFAAIFMIPLAIAAAFRALRGHHGSPREG